MSIPITEVEECPSFLSDEEAAAVPVAALTAWRATFIKAEVKPGDQVLITGIGGGVALFCLQLAVAYGAKVYVTSSNEQKLSRAKQLGAIGGVNYKDPKWINQLLEMLPADRPSLDSIIDSAGGEIVTESLRLLGFGGIISSYGMTLGPKIMFPMQAVMRNIEVSYSLVDFKLKLLILCVVQGFDDGLKKRVQGSNTIY
jgi:NADPH:quinone reductase-like Zn-dependent oxidoreductase